MNAKQLLIDSFHAAVRAACRHAGTPAVHMLGYCIGGTMVTTYMAWANKRFGAEQVPVAHWSAFTTLTDFSPPGDIDVFISEDGIGFLDSSQLAIRQRFVEQLFAGNGFFRFLQPTEKPLVFNLKMGGFSRGLLHIHQHKPCGVPDLVRECAGGVHALRRELLRIEHSADGDGRHRVAAVAHGHDV